MRPSRVFRFIFKIFVTLLTLSVTIVSILGGLSAVMILANPNNIGIDPSEADVNFDIYSLNINFSVPINITNAGYFDLENLEVKIDLTMNYSQIDYPIAGVNQSRVIKIFNKSQNFGNIPQGATGHINFTGLFSEFYFPSEFNYTIVDMYAGPPAIRLLANFTISLDYTLGLHSLTIGLINIPIWEV
jgi:hypothetical protein